MPVFQPAEETAVGAQAMIDDGLFKPFRAERHTGAARHGQSIRRHLLI